MGERVHNVTEKGWVGKVHLGTEEGEEGGNLTSPQPLQSKQWSAD